VIKPKYNPCDMDSLPALAPIGEFLAKLASACPCCSGARIVLAGVVGFVLGAMIL
jgi:hypothetical protein